MARMPGAIWQGEHGSSPIGQIDIVCVHTIVGYAPAHAAHFSVKADGTILQSRDTAFKSAANLDGNYRIIAIENEDHGPAFGNWNTNDGHAVPALTPQQVASNAMILKWANLTHGVPLQLCPDSRPGSRGLAYHRQGIDGNFASYQYPGRVSGGEVWTSSPGKVCPGDRKISQLPDILALALGQEEDDLPYTPEEFEQHVRNAVTACFTTSGHAVRTEVRGLAKSGTDDAFAEGGSPTRVGARECSKLGTADALAPGELGRDRLNNALADALAPLLGKRSAAVVKGTGASWYVASVTGKLYIPTRKVATWMYDQGWANAGPKDSAGDVTPLPIDDELLSKVPTIPVAPTA